MATIDVVASTRSSADPGRVAARTPSGIASSVASSIDEMASAIVCGKASATMSVTGRRVKKSSPRSPCTAFHTKSPTCCGHRLSRPISSRTTATSSGVARGPSMAVAASPGSTRANDASATSTSKRDRRRNGQPSRQVSGHDDVPP